MKQERLSNFELLRMISCFMIIVLHYLNGGMGGALAYIPNSNVNFHVSHLLESLSIVSVNCFVLISGYFLISKKEVIISKIIKLFLTLVFYSLIFYGIAVVTGIVPFSYKELLLCIIPFFAGRRWFIITYILLFLLVPFLNKILANLNQKNYIELLIIFTIFFSIWPTFFPNPPILDGGYGIIHFLYIYMIGGYIKRFFHTDKNRKISLFILYLLCAIFTTTMAIKGMSTAYNYNTIFNVIGSISLFLLFKQIKVKSKLVNQLSSYSFGIFIIHSDPMLRDFVYHSIMKCQEYYTSMFFIVHLLGWCFISYCVCALIDYLKTKLFKKTVEVYVDKNKICNYCIHVE